MPQAPRDVIMARIRQLSSTRRLALRGGRGQSERPESDLEQTSTSAAGPLAQLAHGTGAVAGGTSLKSAAATARLRPWATAFVKAWSAASKSA